jgi:hypothetical protein
VDNQFKPTTRLRVVEDHRSQGVTIDRTVGIQHIFSEHSDDLTPSGFAGLDDLSCQCIGVDHYGAALLEHFGDRAFAGRHATGQPNEHHGGGAYHVVCRATKGD